MAAEIICDLWLCDVNAVTHDEVKKRTELFVSVCKTDLSHYDIFIRDISDKLVVMERLSTEYDKFLRVMDKCIKRGKCVTVFCETGHQRSASLVAAYLVVFARMSAESSIRCIRSKSADAFGSGCVYAGLLKDLESSTVSTSSPW